MCRALVFECAGLYDFLHRRVFFLRTMTESRNKTGKNK